VALSEPRWHPEAILDAEFACNWYAERSPFAARGFLLALEASGRDPATGLIDNGKSVPGELTRNVTDAFNHAL
jgi:hypothetical protein